MTKKYKKMNIISIAIDECLKKTLNYDIFPKYSERVVFPGIFAKILKNYEVKE